VTKKKMAEQPSSENEIVLLQKFKKSLRLNKKLQEKIDFERQVIDSLPVHFLFIPNSLFSLTNSLR
jgi:hypothetical protein